MIYRKRSIILILLCLILASCGVSASSSTPVAGDVNEPIADDLPPINPEISADPVTLEIWVDLDFTRDNTFFEEMAEDFEQAYP